MTLCAIVACTLAVALLLTRMARVQVHHVLGLQQAVANVSITIPCKHWAQTPA